MHAEDVPTVVGSAAKHHAPSRSMNGGRLNLVVIQTPHDITHRSLLGHREGEMDVRGRSKIFLLKMIRRLVSPAQFAARGAQHEIRIETRGQFGGVPVIKSLGAGMYCLVHVLVKRGLRGTWWRDAQARDAAFQIDRYTQLLQKIHSEDSVDLAATRFGDS